MTGRELIDAIHAANAEDKYLFLETQYIEHDPDTGLRIFANTVYAEGDAIATWDTEDE